VLGSFLWLLRFLASALRNVVIAPMHRCVIVRNDQVIGRGSNRTNETRNATRHAELEAIDEIMEKFNGDLNLVNFPECELYVTCEPCIMCAGALSLISIRVRIINATPQLLLSE